MRKIGILLALSALPILTNAQYKLEYGGGIGGCNYLGDIGGADKTRRDFIYDMKVQQTRQCMTGFVRYKLFPTLSVKGSLSYLRIQGSDNLSTNPARNQRNLSFINNMMEISGTAEYYFYRSANSSGRSGMKGSKKKVDFRTFVYTGFGVLRHNPKAQFNGKYVALQPLQTEGVSYSLWTPVVPIGFGVTYTVNRNHRISVDMGWRWTFSDYLDDISTVYVDPATLPNETSRSLSNRNPELWQGTTPTGDYRNYGYHDWNTKTETLNKRGDSNNNDNFLTLSVSYSYVLKGKNKFYKSRYKALEQRRKVVKRKTRAKF